MRNCLNVLLLLSIVSMIQSCSQQNDFLQGERLVFYQPNKKIQFEDIVYAAKMKGAYAHDTLMVQVMMENVGEKSVVVALSEVELLGENDIRSKVVETSRLSVNLKPGATAVDTLYFVPVNDMNLYKQSDLTGKFGPNYFLIPGAVSQAVSSSKGIELAAEASSYTAYLSKGKYIDLELYDIAVSEELEATLLGSISALYAYQKETKQDMNESPKPGVRFARKEILIGGYGMLLKAFVYKGQLNVIYRMVNHQGQTVDFDPGRFKIINGGQSGSPKSITYLTKPSSWLHSDGELRKGERVEVQLTFDEVTDETIVFSPSVTYAEDKVLIEEIPLKRVTLAE